MIVYEETYQDLKNFSSMVYRTLATRKTKASFVIHKSSVMIIRALTLMDLHVLIP